MAWLLVLIALLSSATLNAQARVDSLRERMAVERVLLPAQADTFALSLRRGTFVRIQGEQFGVDLSLVVTAAGAALTWTRNTEGPESRVEEVVLIAPVTGTYQLVVHNALASQSAGRYRLVLAERRSSVPADSVFVRADSLVAARARSADGGRDSVAVRHYQQAMAIHRERGDTLRESRMLLALADMLAEAEDFDSAEAMLSRWRMLNPMPSDTNALLQARHVASVLTYHRGDPERALAEIRATRLIAETIADSVWLAISLSDEGFMLTELGDGGAAEPLLVRAVAMARSFGMKDRLASALNNLASAAQLQGDVERKIEILREVIELSRAEGFTEREEEANNNIGTAYLRLARYRDARPFLERALALAREIQDVRGEATAILNIAGGQWFLGQPDSAKDNFLLARTLQQRIHDRNGEATTLQNLGLYYAETKRDSVNGRAMLEQSAAIFDSVGNVAAAALTHASLGRYLARWGDTAAGEARLATALESFDRIHDPRAQVVVRGWLADIQRHHKDFAGARRTLLLAIAQWDSLYRKLERSGSQVSFFQLGEPSFRSYIESTMQLAASDSSMLQDAFDVAERSRARSMVQRLASVRMSAREGADTALLAKERRILQDIDIASRRAGGATGRQALDSLRLEHERIEALVVASSRGLAALSTPHSLSLKQVQDSLLDAATVLLEYVDGVEHSYLFAIRRDTVAWWQLPHGDILDSLVRTFYEDLTARGSRPEGEAIAAWGARVARSDRAVRTDVRSLGELLLQPAERLIRDKRVVIAPFGALHHLPFGALEVRERGGAAQPLIAAHEVIYLPSATSVALLRSRARPHDRRRKTAVLVGDPVFSSSDPRVTRATAMGARPAAARDSLDPLVSAARSAGVAAENEELPRLEFTRQEVDAIARRIPAGDRSTLLGFDATRAAILAGALNDYRIVHLASHALINDDRPDLSGLALSAVDRSGQPVDGFLRLHHLYGLQLSADVVVLSACQTALGKSFAGEGPSSLARGFIEAGATQVVASLWKVDDQATSVLMQHFYAGMLGPRRLSPAQALQLAQRRMQRDPRWSAPFFWAGFTINGDWRGPEGPGPGGTR